jgi:hypothetical protein
VVYFILAFSPQNDFCCTTLFLQTSPFVFERMLF